MAEGVIDQIKATPGEIKRFPWLALSIGVVFLLLVLFIEAFRPGLVTGPFKSLLSAIGVRGKVA